MAPNKAETVRSRQASELQFDLGMIRKNKKLSLSRTTVRQLNATDLEHAAGGSSGNGSNTYRKNGRMILGAVDPNPPATIATL